MFVQRIAKRPKHGIFYGIYNYQDRDWISLPDGAHWIVRHQYKSDDEKFDEIDAFEEDGHGPIELILSDDPAYFWPVMSFLTDDEAERLANELLAAVRRHKSPVVAG